MGENCDVLVIGGGGAGLRAAIAAHELAPDLRVVLVTKGELGRSGVTATACSDRMAFHATLPTTQPIGPDAWRHHGDDIYRIGSRVSDADLAAVLALGGEEAFLYLERLGVPWARRSDGTIDQFLTDGSIYARACYTGPYTANHIEQALVRRIRALPVRIIETHMAAELLLDESGREVQGVALVSEEDGRICAMAAKAVILATGGAGQAFAVSVFPQECTGDGYALAYRAGTELVNLEFIQIGLCSVKTGLACSGSMMRALPRLINDDGCQFLSRYFAPGASHSQAYAILFAKGASWPVSFREPSHIIDIAVARGLAQGGQVFLDYGRDPVGLDFAALPDHIRLWYAKHTQRAGTKDAGFPASSRMSTPLARLQAINQPSVEWLAARGIDLVAGDLVEIAPAIQHFQGGVKIRTHGETTVAGLYAAGEVAGGQHGANRPGGNALLDGQVFGRISGESAGRYALARRTAPTLGYASAHRAVHALFKEAGLDAETARAQVRQAMSGACGVCRTERGLRELCLTLAAMARRGVRASAGSLTKAVETVNVLQVAMLVARAALERDESRGPHLRFPADGPLIPLPRDDQRWDRYIVVRAGQEGPTLERREPVRPVDHSPLLW